LLLELGILDQSAFHFVIPWLALTDTVRLENMGWKTRISELSSGTGVLAEIF
jgi:hypothetical protein